MKLNRYYTRNFRRLENVEVTLEDSDTIFVGPNNSAKTSATAVFRLFVAQNSDPRIHDFSSPLMALFDTHQIDSGEAKAEFPSIELDLWFSIDPDTEYGRVAQLLPSIAMVHTEIGVQISFSVDDPAELLTAYRTVYPPASVDGTSKSAKSLSHFLSEGTHLKRHFGFKYFSLECEASPFSVEAVKAEPLDKEFGKATLTSLLRVDFVEAQRNIDDIEASRSNRLSLVFADFYKSNLDQPEFDAEAVAVIDKSNDSLSDHYKRQFQPLFSVIGRLGFPSINDRSLVILSSLSSDTALRGNTTLKYEEVASGHQLPEAYNGLGFKNMIFMAIQITHFQKRWICTEKNRPLCHVVFIEEPEVHLHAQVQQTFIRQIDEITTATAAQHKTPQLKPQLVITTHSSHILDEVDFTKVRYFRRVKSRHIDASAPAEKHIKIATEVLSLRDFDPSLAKAVEEAAAATSTPPSATDLEKEKVAALNFLKKYLRLTHCDLFFSDAAILVEGTVERLLLPSFIDTRYPRLKSAYLTVLEVGGAYAHLFIPLVDFIGLPTLIITDLDSVDPAQNRAACRADTSGAVTSNKTLSSVFGIADISALLALKDTDRIKIANGNQRFIAFQTSVPVDGYPGKTAMTPRTFEEFFIYTNLPAVRSKALETFTPLGITPDYETDHTTIYTKVKADGYKKVEFALNQMASEHKWDTSVYICDGLAWLNKVLTPLPLGTLLTPGGNQNG